MSSDATITTTNQEIQAQFRPDTPLPSTPPKPGQNNDPATPETPSPTSSNAQDHSPVGNPSSSQLTDGERRREAGGMELEDAGEDMDMHAMDMTNGEFLDSDVDYLTEDFMQELRRVKVYELVHQTWKDLGTAFCAGDYDDIAGAQLVARTEDTKEVLLQITIRGEDVYQRQADTLIVWTEPDGKDFALSFQDLEGCTEVWDFIQEVRKHLRNERGSSSPYPADFTHPVHMLAVIPTPTLSNIRDIDRQLKHLARSAPAKERAAEQIVNSDMVRKLASLASFAEDLESLEDLHALCTLMQTVLLLNDNTIYEYVLRDDVFLDMVGILEYDPEFPQYKACYRDFLKLSSKYHQVITFRDPGVARKVHQTYRLQYLKDVVLARALDDSTFNLLNSFIIFNQIDIVNYIQNEEYFLAELFGLFHLQDPYNPPPPQPQESEATTDEASTAVVPATSIADQRPAALLLLHQFCGMGKNIQLPVRIQLFRSLVDRGVLWPVQWAFTQTPLSISLSSNPAPSTSETDSNAVALSSSVAKDPKVLNTGGEILTVVLDHDVSGVRGHILRQVEQAQAAAVAATPEQPTQSSPPSLLQVMSEMLAGPQELGFRAQLFESYRVLMDVPGTDATNLPGINKGPKKEDAQSEKFVDYFYKVCANVLFQPLFLLPPHGELTGLLPLSRDQSDLMLYLCDLLSGFLLQHSYQSHFYILSSSISTRVASLLSAPEKHLRLSALRFFRTCLRLNNRNILNHLSKVDVFLPILQLTNRESRRDNILSSCCQEFFEHIRRENFREVIDHVMKTHLPLVEELKTSPIVGARFIGLFKRWEINNEPPVKMDPPVMAPSVRRWGQTQQDPQDAYFNDPEDDGEDGASSSSTLPSPNVKVSRGAKGKLTRKTPVPRPTSVALPKVLPMGGALVDYQEEEESTDASPTVSAPPLSLKMPTGPVPGSNKQQDSPRPGASMRKTRSSSSVKPDLTRTTSILNLAALSSDASIGTGQGMEVEDDDLTGPPLSLSHKRRRDEEEEEEPLERLSKRQAVSKERRNSNGSTHSEGAAKESKTTSKHLKMKITRQSSNQALAAAVEKPTPDTSVQVEGKG